MSSVWEHSQHSGSKLLLLLALADHANEQGVCWPSIPTLAKKARISERQVQRLIQELEDSNELEILKKGNGRGQSTLYRLNSDAIIGTAVTQKVDTVSPINTKKVDIVSPIDEVKETIKGDICDIKGDICDIKGDIAMSPEPPIESPIEPPLQNGGGGSSKRSRKTDTEYAEICTAIESNGFGMLTEFVADEINALMNEYPKDWILDAMKVSVSQNKRKLAYTTGILRRWRADGRDNKQAQPAKKDDQRTASWQGFNNDLPDYMREMMQ